MTKIVHRKARFKDDSLIADVWWIIRRAKTNAVTPNIFLVYGWLSEMLPRQPGLVRKSYTVVQVAKTFNRLKLMNLIRKTHETEWSYLDLWEAHAEYDLCYTLSNGSELPTGTPRTYWR